tara:strand:+ start:1045 stop:1269 length:225 start_codon:yes stop_codon:yes gene_type:complete
LTSSTSTRELTSIAIEAIQQRFSEKEIKAIWVRLGHKLEKKNVIKVRLMDNTLWELKQKMRGKTSWKQINVPVG